MPKHGTFQAKQLYKNRAEAYRLFIVPQGLPVGQTKFYNDAERLRLIGLDKTIELATLLAYVREELQVDPASGRSLVQKDYEQQLAELDYQEKRLKVAKLEKEGRKDDRDWIHREKVNEREGALVGQIQEDIMYQLDRAAPAVITLCRGDRAREVEVRNCLKEALYNAFRNLYEAQEIEVAFEDGEE